MPRVRSGKCRRCGCTDAWDSCGGCAWVDPEHTRCSFCFEWDKKAKAFVKLEREESP